MEFPFLKGAVKMQNEGYKIVINIEPAKRNPADRYTKYKCCFYEVVKDDVGKRWLKAKKVCSYDSVEMMEQDIEGFTLFYEYEIEERMEDGVYERNNEAGI